MNSLSHKTNKIVSSIAWFITALILAFIGARFDFGDMGLTHTAEYMLGLFMVISIIICVMFSLISWAEKDE